MAAATAMQSLSPTAQQSARAAATAEFLLLPLQDAAPSHSDTSRGKDLSCKKGLVYVLVRTHLILPRNGHTSSSKLLVEVIVRGLQLHSFHRGELLDVQNILAVDGLGLNSTNIALMPGCTMMTPTETTWILAKHEPLLPACLSCVLPHWEHWSDPLVTSSPPSQVNSPFTQVNGQSSSPRNKSVGPHLLR